jgi:hypothetical protein
MFLSNVGLRVPNRYFGYFSLFYVDLNVEISLPLDALGWQMPAAVILMYSMDVGSRLMIGCYLILLLDNNSEISDTSYATKITCCLWFERS